MSLNRFISGIRSRFYRWRDVSLQPQSRLQVGASLTLNKPLRCDGAGRVVLGNGVTLGYALSPCVGTGEILLQAREATIRSLATTSP